MSEADIEALVRQLVERARDGDLGAIKLVFAYTIGQPTEAVNPDTLDWQEWQQYRDAFTNPTQVAILLNQLPQGVACELMRTVLPSHSQRLAAQFLGTPEAEPAQPGSESETAEKNN